MAVKKAACSICFVAIVISSLWCCTASSVSSFVNVQILYSKKVASYNECFQAKTDWQWVRLWSSLNVKVKNEGPSTCKITVVRGDNKTDVKTQLQHNSLLPSLLPLWFQPNRRMTPLKNHCIGIQADEVVHVTITETYMKVKFLKPKSRNKRKCGLLASLVSVIILPVVNEIYLLLTVVGVVLFLTAPRLSKSVVFHYSTGVTLGVLASLLILVYILSRFIPRKTGAVSLLIGGWAMCLYFLHWVLDNFISIQYKTYLIGYFVLAAMISFVVCYWYGPVTSDRTMYLIQLFLQLVGLVCIYNGSQHEGSTVALVLVLLLLRWLPCRHLRKVSSLFRWRWQEPVKIRLLTEDEYYEQGRVETKKALDKLREYCRSPECNQWKMIANLESPKRFAQFVMEEEDHVNQNEISAYEEELSLLTLDSSSSENELEISSDSEMEIE